MDLDFCRLPPEEPGCWYAAFGSLFQGDHLGVEFALQAHEALLQSHGLLVAERRLQGHQIFPVGDEIEGLIIDDFFAIGKEKLDSQPISSFAAKALAAAREAYEFHRLPGSPEKDVEAETFFKAAEAEVDSSSFAVRRGLTTVAAPLSKRLGLSVLSLRAARLASTSSRLLSRLAGNWTSVLMFKRCLMATVDDMFALAAEAEKIGKNYVVHQSPAVRTELIMLGALAPSSVRTLPQACALMLLRLMPLLGKELLYAQVLKRRSLRLCGSEQTRRAPTPSLTVSPATFLLLQEKSCQVMLKRVSSLPNPTGLCSCTTILSSSLGAQAVFPRLPTDWVCVLLLHLTLMPPVTMT